VTVVKLDRAKRLRAAKAKEGERKAKVEAFRNQPDARKTIIGAAFADEYDPLRRGEEADAALTLYANDKMLIKAFTEFQLDPNNPHHWKLLAQYMADTLFAKSGAGLKWTRAAELRLVSAVDDAVASDPAGHKKAVDRAVAALQRTPTYRSFGVSTLRTKYFGARKKVRK
jgi:hypothetical protein